MKRLVPFVLAGVLLASPASAHEVLVVSEPMDLRFVPMREAFVHIRGRFEGQVDLVDRLRREAFKRMSADWGVPPADKKDVRLGCVARTDASGRLSYALVLTGDIDSLRLKDKMVNRHAASFKARGLTPGATDVEVAGHKGVRLPYSERAGVYTLVPMGRYFMIASTPKDDVSLAEQVVKALEAPDQLGKGPVPTIQINVRVELSARERKLAEDFRAEQLNAGLNKLRDRFMKLHDKLRPDGAKADDLKSLDERINELFLKAESFDLSLSYQPGAGEDDDVYTGRYVMHFTSPEQAQAMRQMLLEKTLLYKENAVSPGLVVALDAAHIDAQDKWVKVKVPLDTRPKRHDAAFAYLAFLLSFPGSNKALGIATAN